MAVASTPLLTARERELVILATCGVARAEFCIQSHVKIGMEAGLSQGQAEGAVRGEEEVDGLEEREREVYGLGLVIARGVGKVEDGVFERGVEVLGRDRVSAVAQVVGLYYLAGVLVNVADVK